MDCMSITLVRDETNSRLTIVAKSNNESALIKKRPTIVAKSNNESALIKKRPTIVAKSNNESA